MSPVYLREKVCADGHFVVLVLFQKALGFLVESLPGNVQHSKDQISQIVGFFQPYSGLVFFHILRDLQLIFDFLQTRNYGRSSGILRCGLSVYGCLPLPFAGHLERNEKIRFFKAKDKICRHEKVLDNCRNLTIKYRKNAEKAYVFTPFSHRNTRQKSRQDSRIPDDCPHAYLSEKIYKNSPRRVKYTLRGSLSVHHKSIKPQLFLLAGLYRPFFHHILRKELPAEKR